ncbi:MAG: metallophosphoesterase family protein [Clostridia bacterium]|nr:metallophosphoesterase family protein [Clostridia bacterium]
MKNIRIFIVIVLTIVLSVAVAAAVIAGSTPITPYTYEPCEDFANIAVTFYENGANGRAFSFTTAGLYENECVVQLDPAEKEEAEPVFNARDNIILDAESSIYIVNGEYFVHRAATKDLTAGTKYFYRVGNEELDRWSEWGSFVTDDGDDDFTFLYITDPQADTNQDFDSFSETMHTAFDQHDNIEFVASMGDQVEWGPSQYQWDKFFAAIKDIIMSTTFACANGNHEIFPDIMNAHFYIPNMPDLVGIYYYAFEYGDCLFMVIDTNFMNLSSQLDFMSSVMSKSKKTWNILGMHYSMFSSGSHAEDDNVMNEKEQLVPFISQNKIDLVISGHDHNYARTYPIDAAGNVATADNKEFVDQNGYQKTVYTNPKGGIYVINRCVGTKFYGSSNRFNDYAIEKGDSETVRIPIYSTITISGNKLTYTAYEYNINTTKEITVFDCIEIIKEP